MTIKKTIPALLLVWLWLSAPFFSHISFMNDSLRFVSDGLSKIIPIDWLVPVLLLLGIPCFSLIFYQRKRYWFKPALSSISDILFFKSSDFRCHHVNRVGLSFVIQNKNISQFLPDKNKEDNTSFLVGRMKK